MCVSNSEIRFRLTDHHPINLKSQRLLQMNLREEFQQYSDYPNRLIFRESVAYVNKACHDERITWTGRRLSPIFQKG